MKVLILIASLLCLSAGVRSTSIRINDLDEELADLGFQEDITDILEELEDKILSRIPQTTEELGPILHSILRSFSARNSPDDIEGLGSTGLIPPGLLPDPFVVPTINLTSLDLGIISGDLLLTDGILQGLGNLTDDLTAAPVGPPLGISAVYKLIVPFVELNGSYDFNLLIDFLGNELTLIGAGPCYVTFTDLALVFDLDIRKKNDSNFVDASLQLRIDGLLHGIFPGLEFVGHPVTDWEEFSNLTWSILYGRIEDSVLIPIATNLTIVVNDLLQECTIMDLLSFFFELGGDLSCVPLFNPSSPVPGEGDSTITSETDPTESGSESTSTTTTPNPNSSIRTLASFEVLIMLAGVIRLLNFLH